MVKNTMVYTSFWHLTNNYARADKLNSFLRFPALIGQQYLAAMFVSKPFNKLPKCPHVMPVLECPKYMVNASELSV